VTLLETGIGLFNDGAYFRCHEVLEEAWTTEVGRRRLFLQSLIHFAVGFYHCQRGNPVGAVAQVNKGLVKLAAYLPAYEGVDTERLLRESQGVFEKMKSGETGLEFPRIQMIE
jgi:hypothetical protein